MAVSASAQTIVFLLSCGVGLLLGLLYDVFRVIRLVTRCGRAAIVFQDILFLLACTLTTFLFMLWVNSGDIRFFIIMGEILGAVLYYLTLGVLVMKLAAKTVTAAGRCQTYVRRKVGPPVRHAYAKVNRQIDQKGIKAKKLLIKENNLIKLRLKVAQKMLYNLVYVKKAKKGETEKRTDQKAKKSKRQKVRKSK